MPYTVLKLPLPHKSSAAAVLVAGSVVVQYTSIAKQVWAVVDVVVVVGRLLAQSVQLPPTVPNVLYTV